jgi:engulfment/cell motility protein 1
MLALDMMYAFACSYPEQYNKVVLENSCRSDNHECPFAKTSIEIVKLICGIIRIGQPPSSDHGAKFYPMFFTHENPLEELFAIIIQHVYKTWREMRATNEDFRKVMDVAKEQVGFAVLTSIIVVKQKSNFNHPLMHIYNLPSSNYVMNL